MIEKIRGVPDCAIECQICTASPMQQVWTKVTDRYCVRSNILAFWQMNTQTKEDNTKSVEINYGSTGLNVNAYVNPCI